MLAFLFSSESPLADLQNFLTFLLSKLTFFFLNNLLYFLSVMNLLRMTSESISVFEEERERGPKL